MKLFARIILVSSLALAEAGAFADWSDADLRRFTPGSPWGLGNADNAINHYRRIMEWAHINVTLPDDARILRCDGSLSYIISIVEANGNRYLFCERI